MKTLISSILLAAAALSDNAYSGSNEVDTPAISAMQQDNSQVSRGIPGCSPLSRAASAVEERLTRPAGSKGCCRRPNLAGTPEGPVPPALFPQDARRKRIPGKGIRLAPEPP